MLCVMPCDNGETEEYVMYLSLDEHLSYQVPIPFKQSLMQLLRNKPFLILVFFTGSVFGYFLTMQTKLEQVHCMISFDIITLFIISSKTPFFKLLLLSDLNVYVTPAPPPGQ